MWFAEEMDAGGNYLSAKQCVTCATGTLNFPTRDRYSCVGCPDKNMTFSPSFQCLCNSGFTQVCLSLTTCVCVDVDALITLVVFRLLFVLIVAHIW